MEKKLIALYVPSVEQSFDVFVPGELEIGRLIDELITGVISLTDGQYCRSGGEHLCLAEPEMLLKEGYTLDNYGIKNGNKLILI